MAKTDYKARSDADLANDLQALKREQLNLRFQAATQQLEKATRVREVRRAIARIQTEQNARAKAQATQA
ncbi:50S ribosomal protein L29 [Sandaracinobacteroides sp. A072]|uniref:50S ribosomal protein L29 n=1 Tax=Sandaracinobacteroides sp. A072 TaxID=3461146 RepID=UPI00404315A2